MKTNEYSQMVLNDGIENWKYFKNDQIILEDFIKMGIKLEFGNYMELKLIC